MLILPSAIILLIGIGISLILRNRNKYVYTKKSFKNEARQKEKEDGKVLLMEKEEGYFCPFCGSKIDLFLRACPNCGTLIKNEEN